MKASLLGCGQEQQASKKDDMGTEEKCMYEYNLTLSFEETMGRSVHILPKKTIKSLLSFVPIKPKWKSTISQTGSKEAKKALKTRFWSRYNSFAIRTVMLDRGGVELICSILKPDMDVLEYGSGGSTTFFRWKEARSRDDRLSYSYHAETSEALILILVNLSRAGQAWSTTATGNQRCLVFKSEAKWKYFEGEKHPQDVTLGGQGDPLPCPSRHAFKIFWGYWRRIQVWGCGKYELGNIVHTLMKYPSMGGNFLQIMQIIVLMRKTFHKFIQELHRQACISGSPVWSYHRWHKYDLK